MPNVGNSDLLLRVTSPILKMSETEIKGWIRMDRKVKP